MVSVSLRERRKQQQHLSTSKQAVCCRARFLLPAAGAAGAGGWCCLVCFAAPVINGREIRLLLTALLYNTIYQHMILTADLISSWNTAAASSVPILVNAHSPLGN